MTRTMINADDRLSRAASAVWRMRTAEDDPMGDPSGDCGSLVAGWHRGLELKAVAAAGYATPGEYNADLIARTADAGGRVHGVAGMLGIEDVCPVCGAAMNVSCHRTAQYGGGWDSFLRCPSCGHCDVCV